MRAGRFSMGWTVQGKLEEWHQHTRLLENGISDLRERADGTRAEDVRTSSRLQQGTVSKHFNYLVQVTPPRR